MNLYCPNCKKPVRPKMAPYCDHKLCNCSGPKVVERCPECGSDELRRRADSGREDKC